MRLITKTKGTLILAIAAFLTVNAQTDSVFIDTISNYQGWGTNWGDILVVKNKFVTLGIVPGIGGRVLQYDIGVDTFMITNSSLYRQTFTPSAGNYYGPYTSWGYGGYKTWPAPQDVWNWPPPPLLAWGSYDYEVFQTTKDSIVIRMKGQTEQYATPDLRFDRYMTMYANSSRVKVVTVLFNDHVANTQNWAVWDVTQTIVRHENKTDYNNFSAYFPLESEDDVWYTWGDVPERDFVLPGIYQVKYSGAEGKIFAVASDGWVAFTDERDKQTYAKVFDIVEGADYSDGGAMVHIYTNGSNKYMEVEALGPLEDIGANGDSIIWIEDWYASATDGPFYYIGHEGTINEHLYYDTLSNNLSGEFSAFYEGEFRVTYLDESEGVLASGSVYTAIPTAVTIIDESVTLPDNTRYIDISSFDYSDNLVGVLDRIDMKNIIEPPPDSYREISGNNDAELYPVPANEFINIVLSEHVNSNILINIFSMTGQVLQSENINAGQKSATIFVGELPAGAYCVEISGQDFLINKQIIIQ